VEWRRSSIDDEKRRVGNVVERAPDLGLRVTERGVANDARVGADPRIELASFLPGQVRDLDPGQRAIVGVEATGDQLPSVCGPTRASLAKSSRPARIASSPFALDGLADVPDSPRPKRWATLAGWELELAGQQAEAAPPVREQP
jgi:hypothetical protein